MDKLNYVEDLRAVIGHKRIILNGSATFIVDARGRILMQQRTYPYGKWGLPGGIMELGESTEETARREVLEETGLTLGAMELFGVYSGQGYLCVAQNGDEYYVVCTVYLTREYTGTLRVNDSESLAFDWFGIDALPADIPRTHREMISDYIKKYGGTI